MAASGRGAASARLVAAGLAVVLSAVACSSPSGDDAGTTTTMVPDQTSTAPPVTEPPPPPRWSIDPALSADPDCVTPVAGVPLRIGYAADLSETGSPFDSSATEAALHLVRLINCSGGVDGQPVDVQVVDISGSPVTTRDGVRELMDAGAAAIIGPPTADPGLRVLQVTDGAIPVVFASSTTTALADPTRLSFLAAFDDSLGAASAARFALDQGWTSAVTFSGPGPTFGYKPLVFAEAFGAGGGTVQADYAYVPGETGDFATAVADMTAAGAPDVIYSTMEATQVAALRAQLAAAGLGPEFVAGHSFEATGGYSIEGADGVLHTAHVFSEPGSRIALLEDSFRESTGDGFPSPTFAALAADAMTVILDAYLRSGKATPVGIGAAIAEGTDIQGVTGVLDYDGRGSPTKPVYIHRVVDGRATLAGIVGG